MTRLEVCVLETEGFAILSATRAQQLREEYEPLIEIEELERWGDFRSHACPLELATDIVDASGIEVAEYVAAVEAANGVDGRGLSLEARWDRACRLPNGPAEDSDAPTDDEEFSYQRGEYEASFELSLMLQAWMMDDLPRDLIDDLGLAYDSTLDGPLGLVPSEQLDEVCDRLVALGFEFDHE